MLFKEEGRRRRQRRDLGVLGLFRNGSRRGMASSKERNGGWRRNNPTAAEAAGAYFCHSRQRVGAGAGDSSQSLSLRTRRQWVEHRLQGGACRRHRPGRPSNRREQCPPQDEGLQFLSAASPSSATRTSSACGVLLGRRREAPHP
ncbi:unnamed protein product [Musa acuminata subsp. burmannicoides]